MRHVHLNILVCYLVKRYFRHSLNVRQNGGEVQSIGEGESALADILGSNLTRKIIQASEDVCVNLLQALYRSRLQRIQQPAFKEVICPLLALSVDSIVAVGEPV